MDGKIWHGCKQQLFWSKLSLQQTWKPGNLGLPTVAICIQKQRLLGGFFWQESEKLKKRIWSRATNFWPSHASQACNTSSHHAFCSKKEDSSKVRDKERVGRFQEDVQHPHVCTLRFGTWICPQCLIDMILYMSDVIVIVWYMIQACSLNIFVTDVISYHIISSRPYEIVIYPGHGLEPSLRCGRASHPAPGGACVGQWHGADQRAPRRRGRLGCWADSACSGETGTMAKD